MKTKIYEKNNFKKYFNKNEEFNEAYIPNHIRNSINNTISPKKSFSNKENQNQNKNYNYNYQANQTNELDSSNKNYDFNNNQWKNRSAAYLNAKHSNNHTNNSSNFTHQNQNQNQKNFGFSKFLEKKNVYDRLADLRDSIGKRKINSPFLVLSNHEHDKKEFYDQITNTAPNEYFVHSPRKIKALLSINSIKESKNNNSNNNTRDEFLLLNKKGERSFSSTSYSNTLFHTNKASNCLMNNNKFLNFTNNANLNKKQDGYYFNTNIDFDFNGSLRNALDNHNNKMHNNKQDEELNRSSNSCYGLKGHNNNRTQLSLIVKEPSKVNILHKIEQYKDYLKFKLFP